MSFSVDLPPVPMSLHHHATICLQNLKLLSAASVKDEWGEDQLFRFNSWAANSSIFTSGHASMDWRLRDLGDLQRMMVSTLEVLHRHITVLLNPSHDTRRDASLSVLTQKRSPSPSSSDSDSSTSIIFKSLKRRQSSSDVSRYAIEETLDQLFRLTAFIRKAAIRNRYLKAAKFEEVICLENGEFVNITKEFREGVRILINARHPHASQKLRDRLVETISLRHKQLSYSQSQKQDHDLEMSKLVSERQVPSAPSLGEDISAPLPSAMHARPESISARAQTLKKVAMVTPSQKSASVVSRSRLPQTFSAKPSSVGSAMQNHSPDLWVPPPPRNLRYGAKEFECPICFIVQPIERASGDKWKQHALKDILPYICVMDDCKTPYTMYSTTSSWVNHMQQEHSAHQWVCTLHPEDVPFDLEVDFVNHTLKEHDCAFNDVELEILVQSSLFRLPWTESLPICPLCYESPESASVDMLRYHIADHLRSLAMIPFIGLNDDAEGSVFSSASRVSIFSNDDLGVYRRNSVTFQSHTAEYNDLHECVHRILEACSRAGAQFGAVFLQVCAFQSALETLHAVITAIDNKRENQHTALSSRIDQRQNERGGMVLDITIEPNRTLFQSVLVKLGLCQREFKALFLRLGRLIDNFESLGSFGREAWERMQTLGGSLQIIFDKLVSHSSILRFIIRDLEGNLSVGSFSWLNKLVEELTGTEIDSEVSESDDNTFNREQELDDEYDLLNNWYYGAWKEHWETWGAISGLNPTRDQYWKRVWDKRPYLYAGGHSKDPTLSGFVARSLQKSPTDPDLEPLSLTEKSFQGDHSLVSHSESLSGTRPIQQNLIIFVDRLLAQEISPILKKPAEVIHTREDWLIFKTALVYGLTEFCGSAWIAIDWLEFPVSLLFLGTTYKIVLLDTFATDAPNDNSMHRYPGLLTLAVVLMQQDGPSNENVKGWLGLDHDAKISRLHFMAETAAGIELSDFISAVRSCISPELSQLSFNDVGSFKEVIADTVARPLERCLRFFDNMDDVQHIYDGPPIPKRQQIAEEKPQVLQLRKISQPDIEPVHYSIVRESRETLGSAVVLGDLSVHWDDHVDCVRTTHKPYANPTVATTVALEQSE